MTTVALVHDDLMQTGGAERVAVALHDMFPSAPLYTAMYDAGATFAAFADMEVRPSFLQRTPLALRRLHKLALPFFPAAFEEFDFSGFDLVLSNTTRFAKGIVTPPETCHVCYCHTPPRFAWRPQDYREQNAAARLLAPLMRQTLVRLRTWDVAAAQRVDYFVAGSENAARRIRKYYRREAAVIHPPVRTDRYAPAPPSEVGDHFLVVSRLVGYKRVDLAIEACNRLRLPLRVVGSGPEFSALRRLAGPTVLLLGRLSDSEIAREYAQCRALIFPGEEDFGLTPIEAMASGRPVVAYGSGGALETVIAGRTGVFFQEQTPAALAAALRQVCQIPWDSDALVVHARRFDERLFQRRMRQFVDEALSEHQRYYAGPLCEPGDQPETGPLARRLFK